MKNLYLTLVIIIILSCVLIDHSLSEEKWICPNCRNELSSKFCPDCGSKRPEMTPAPSPITITKKKDNYGELYKSAANWLNCQLQDIESKLDEIGFSLVVVDKTTVINVDQYSYNSSDYDIMISLFTDNDKTIVERVEFVFPASKTLFKSIYNMLKSDFGPVTISYSNETFTSELALWWNKKNAKYRLSGDAFSVTPSFLSGKARQLEELEKNDLPFSLSLSEHYGPVVTQKPKSTPIPVKCEVQIKSIKISRNSIGVPRLYVVFSNLSDSPIDRIDFYVKCYDTYGSRIKGYNFYDYFGGYYEQTTIQRRQSSLDYWYWDMNGFDGANRVEIAIEKYHKTNGKTVSIPESQWQWIDSSKNISSYYSESNQNTSSEAKGKIRINTGSYPNVRSKPSVDSEKLGNAYSEKVYELLAKSGSWYKIKLDDGTIGWISSGMAEIIK